MQRRRPVAACSAPLRRRLEAAFSVVVWLGAAERGCARSVRRATGGGDDPYGSPLQPPQLALARRSPPLRSSLCSERCKVRPLALRRPRFLCVRSPSITVAHEPWWHQQRAGRGAVSVLSPGGAAKRGNAGVGPATWKRCLCRDAVERWMVV